MSSQAPEEHDTMEAVNVCRCCLSEGLHKDLHAPYVWMNNKEIYADMLDECFNISLSSSPYVSNSICDLCIGCLRNAASFRHQVLRAEAAILQQITGGVKQNEISVKEEPIDSDGNASDDFTLADTIKMESHRKLKEDYKPSKKIMLPKQSIHKKVTPAKNIMKTSARSITLDAIGRTLSLPDIKLKKIIKTPPNKNRPKPEKIDENSFKQIRTRQPNRNQINFLDKGKNRHNLQTVLKFSNATPFRKQLSTMVGFNCMFCNEICPNIEELRNHVDTKHELERSDFGTKFDHSEMSAKVDISSLRCRLCDEKLDSLANLITHLINVHKKKYYTDVKDIIVPYKLDKKQDLLECALCSSTYETFKMLSQHMNTHFSNYICDICGASFITKRSKDTHDKRHEEGEAKCQLCEKVYANKQRLHYHNRMIHEGKAKTRTLTYCHQCNEKFTTYYQRNQHMNRVHNVESPYKCNICNRQFVLKTLLMYHIKKSHMMEKEVACPVCGKRFFSKRTLKGHMLKHTGEKNYVCDVCNKAYGRRYTLREHMRIHNNDRRFKCDVCEMTFVQKCSLRSHLLTNHGISMAASDISANIQSMPS